MRWFARSAMIVLLVVAGAAATAEANEYLLLHVYQQVKFADVIVIGTVTDARTATVRVDHVFKGAAPRSIRLIHYIDSFLRPADRRGLVNGEQELMFLNREDAFYAPLQTQFGRWPIQHGRLVTNRRLDLQNYRKTIERLVRLQAQAERGVSRATDAYVDALRDPDPHVKLWAAAEAPEQVDNPSPRLVTAYLKLWETNDEELRSRAVNGVITWKVAHVAPIFAAALRDGTEDERTLAARALGGTEDETFLPQLRAAATSDPSVQVRGGAYEGLAHLLGPDAMPDLLAGAQDHSPRVRESVAYHAVNLIRKFDDRALLADVRRLLEMLAVDPDSKVRRSVEYLKSEVP